MANDPGFDAARAHRYFSADCFNKAWELIEKTSRTPQEDEEMFRLNQASIWHWTQREDCKNSNLSIGYWQASRIRAISGHTDEARRYAELCLQYSGKDEAFLLAYAYEALARAEKLAGNSDLFARHRDEAMRIAETVSDAEDREMLKKDLAAL